MKSIALITLMCCTGMSYAQSCIRWWQAVEPTPPPAHNEDLMVFDESRGVVVLFDGRTGLAPGTGTAIWERGDEGWTPRPASGATPGYTIDAAMAYVPSMREVFVYGGQVFTSQQRWRPTNDMKAWNGVSWRYPIQGGTPDIRDHSAMVFDTQRNVIVLFGGQEDDGWKVELLDDTWVWRGDYLNSWTGVYSVHKPSPRYKHGLAYDAQRGVVVLYGGATEPPGGSDETWEWDGVDWTFITDQGPGPSVGPLVYDTRRHLCILLRLTSEGSPCETWEWDGVVWSLRSSSGPTSRYGHAMAYDEARRRTVVFGGQYGRDLFNDTWEYGLYPDCDQTTGAGELDIFDVLCFLNKFAAQEPYACDCDTATGQGVCDVFDFMCFQELFAGCP